MCPNSAIKPPSVSSSNTLQSSLLKSKRRNLQKAQKASVLIYCRNINFHKCMFQILVYLPFHCLGFYNIPYFGGEKKDKKRFGKPKFKKFFFFLNKSSKNKYFHLNSMPLFQTSFSFTYLSNTGLTLSMHLNSWMFARNLKREKTFLYVF